MVIDNSIDERVLERLKDSEIQQLIEDGNWLELYEEFPYPSGSGWICGVLTSLLMGAGINPLASLTEIPSYFFYNHDELTSFTVPSQITEIGDHAFGSCRHLKEIVFNKNLDVIGSASFEGCTSIITLDIPDSVSTIGHYAFSGCSRMMTIIFGHGLRYIGRNIYNTCNSLHMISYRGTKQEWRRVLIDGDNRRLRTMSIYCTDGVLRWDDSSRQWIEA